jgi:hypothetical protein
VVMMMMMIYIYIPEFVPVRRFGSETHVRGKRLCQVL